MSVVGAVYNLIHFFLFFFNIEDDLSLLRRNRMALFQQLTCVLPILDNLLKANVINKQEHDIIKQKTQIPLQARELIDTVLVKGNSAANIFKNCLKEIDPTLYKNLFGEFVVQLFLELCSSLCLINKLNPVSKLCTFNLF